MRLYLLLILLFLSNYSFSQGKQKVEKYHSRLTKQNYFKLDFGQFLMLEGGVNYEHNFNGLWSFCGSIGLDGGSPFYTAGFSGRQITTENHLEMYSSLYKLGYFMSIGGRRYVNKFKDPKGFYVEMELKYKLWSKTETELHHGGYSIHYIINDFQAIPIVGWVPNRAHWIEMYVGLGFIHSFGDVKGYLWGATPNGEYSTGINYVDQKVDFNSIRPKTGIRFCL